MNDFDNIADALRVFQEGPATPGWDHAACYLLDERTPPAIRDQVEGKITDAMKAIYGFTFQVDAYTDRGEPVMTARVLAERLGIGERQLVSWVRWLDKRYGRNKSLLRRSRRLQRLQ